MSWSIGYDTTWHRDVGYGVPATCDHPGCTERIDRGLSYVCGGEPMGGERGCGLFFCSQHRQYFVRLPQLCARCARRRGPFDPSPDVPEWIQHKLTDESWGPWRAENPGQVAALQRLAEAFTS